MYLSLSAVYIRGDSDAVAGGVISESNRKLQSFIAAIQLGLKKRFKGKIDHLQTTVHEASMPDSSFKRKYLVLYDTVPGGTGYLKQLMRPKNQLMDVLEMSLDALKSCACNQDKDKDGCYRCLFAYVTATVCRKHPEIRQLSCLPKF